MKHLLPFVLFLLLFPTLSAQSWHPIGQDASLDLNCVNAITKFKGRITIGGDFEMGKSKFNRVAIWNGQSWQAIGTGISNSILTPSLSSVHALTNFNDTLVAGGCFWDNGIAYWVRWDETDWVPFSDSVFSNACVNFVLAVGDSLLLGGSAQFGPIDSNFNNTDGIAIYQKGKLIPVGEGLLVGANLTRKVRTIFPYLGSLYVGGEFDLPFSGEEAFLAHWDGSSWNKLGQGLNDDVYTIAVYHDTLYVGGEFTEAGGKSAHTIAYWTDNQWHAVPDFQPNALYHNQVNTMAVYDDKLFVGGSLTGNISSDTLNSLVVYDGHQWKSAVDVSGGIHTLTVIEDTLYAGGCFYRMDGISTNNVAAYYPEPMSSLDSKETANIKISPNPAYDQVQLIFSIPPTAPIKIQIHDMTGKLVATEHTPPRSRHQMDIHSLPSGAYLITINSENKIWRNYVIKGVK